MKHKVDLTFPKIKWRAAPPLLPWSSAQGTVPRYQAVGRPCSKGQSSVSLLTQMQKTLETRSLVEDCCPQV